MAGRCDGKEQEIRGKHETVDWGQILKGFVHHAKSLSFS